jgi:hypothetical protein
MAKCEANAPLTPLLGEQGPFFICLNADSVVKNARIITNAPLTPLERELCEAMEGFCAPIKILDEWGLAGSVPQHDRECYSKFQALLAKAKDCTNG